MVSRYLVRAVEDPADEEARAHMLLAASYAGIGFGNAGVHLPHGMSYPVSGMVRDYYAEGYPRDHALLPHGFSVILNAPAVFRFTSPACPQRHLEAAAALGADVSRCRPEDAGKVLADRILWFMREAESAQRVAGDRLHRFRHSRLVEGTLPQHRVTKLSPRPAGPERVERAVRSCADSLVIP